MDRILSASWPRLLVSAVAVAALFYWLPWPGAADIREPALSATCAAWDREAGVGVALLVPDPSALAEAQLDVALYQLRRARKNCRLGLIELAREDYAVLQNAHPFPNREASRRGEAASTTLPRNDR
jgi:hypothetical protein